MAGRYKNVLMILHVTGLIPFVTFKNKIFNWLQINNIFLSMMLFCNTKETETRIRHLMMVHPKWIYHTACQEHFNKALAMVVLELDEENKNYYSDYDTMWKLATYNVQIKSTMPSITIGNTKTETTALAVYALQLHAGIAQDLIMRVVPHVDHRGFKFLLASLPYDKSIWDGKLQYAQLIKEQNQFLVNYKNFCIGGISEDMMDTTLGESTLQELLELPQVVGDITLAPFTKSKGIWQVETTKGQLLDAMHHVSEVLLKTRDQIPEN
eukprot:3092258-Ditylum_brightwellii.AAC.1